MSEEMLKSSCQPEIHPCFSSGCNGFARIHLPVAPRCNIQCNYCLRRFSCANESRPGVTSRVMAPHAALEYFRQAQQQYPQLRVAGIAGPGDALANWYEVRETLKLIKKERPDILLCLSTNGLLLPEYADELIEIGVKYLTVTINAVKAATAAQIYQFVTWQGKSYTGQPAAELLLSRQKEGLAKLQASPVKIKLNTVAVPDINLQEIEDIAELGAKYGVHSQNILPLLPVAGTPFATKAEPPAAELQSLRAKAARHLPQMKHCCRCRADAVGTL